MECQENIENPIESDSNFAPIFVNHHLLPEISFSWHYLIKNNISFPKKVINLYIFYIHRIYFKYLLIWIREAN